MKLSLDFVRTLPMNVAKTKFSSPIWPTVFKLELRFVLVKTRFSTTFRCAKLTGPFHVKVSGHKVAVMWNSPLARETVASDFWAVNVRADWFEDRPLLTQSSSYSDCGFGRLDYGLEMRHFRNVSIWDFYGNVWEIPTGICPSINTN